MAIDLSKLSDEDLDALEKGDLTKLSDAALDLLEGRERPAATPAAAPVEPFRKGPQGPRRYPGQNEAQRRRLEMEQARKPLVERRPLMRPDEYGERFGAEPEVGPSLQEVARKGKAVALGVPGGAVRMTRGVAELGGETETSRALKELEASIAAKTPETGAYEAGRILPEILPFGATAAAISKLPVASRLGMSALQAAGQAGTAYAVSPENREEAALITGLLGAAGEAAQPVYQLGKRAFTRARQLLSTTGAVGATPAEEAAVRIAREKAPGMEATEAELAAARESERLKREEAERLKAKYLQNEADRAARKGELVKAKAAAEEAKARVEAETSAAVKDAKAKQDAIADQIRDRGKQLTEEAKATDKVLEETNIREAAEDAKGTLEDRASGFKTLAQNLKQEADAAKATAVEPLPVRDKKSRAVDFRQLILSKRENLKEARDKSIGRVVDPKTGKTEPLPFLKAALDKEDAGQTISAAPAFRNLVNFVRDRAENISRYGDDVLLPHAKFLKELEPIRETIDASGQKVKEVVPIKFEKLWELRRRIEKARTGETATGYEVLEKEKREDLLKEIDNALDEFGVGYKDFNKKYSEASRPLDDFEFGIGEKATETRKFSRNTFIETPEVVLDTALSKPSRSSAERLKPLFEDADQDKLENIIFESLVEKAGNTAKGYDDVLKKYGEFLEVFPNAKNAFRAEADRVKTAFGEAEKTAAFKERWAKRMEDRADKAEKAVKSISGMQERVKTSMTSPLKEGALDDIGAFVRANPSMRPKVGAALQDVLNSMDDRVLIRALEVPERQAAFMRAGMDRSQIDDVLAGARRRSDERAAKLAEVKEMGRSFREAKKETEAAKSAAAESKRAAIEEVKKAGAEIGKVSTEGRAEEIAKKQAQAEFQAARGLRVSVQQKRQALSELTPDMRDAINIEAEKIPLNTTEGLARATTLATVLGGVGSVIAGSVLGGILAAGTAAAGATGRRILIKKQQKQIAEEIKSAVSEILKDETGGAVSAIEKKIERANDVAAAQRIANKALSRLGYKPGVGAVTSSVIYNAYAQEPSPEAEKTEPVVEEAPVSEPVAEEAPAKEPVAEEPAPVAEAKPYTFESLTPNQVKRMGEYFDSLGMNKDFLLNARTFNSTPLEKRKRLFDLMETRNMADGGSVDAERQRVEAEIKKHPWYSEFYKQFNYYPDLGPNADYDYITAWKAGIRPERDPYDKNRYHWSSRTREGVILKKPGHPTLWKTFFMDQTGINPDAIGIKNEQEAQAYINAQRVKKARGEYTPAEEVLLRRYADGGPVKRPTLPADRYAGYKQVGESNDRLLRFFEAAARELPDAIKQNVTSNADLAAKYLKFKFGMMSPEEMMAVARALPESLKGAAVAAMQAVKEAPKAVAKATPESAGKFAGQMLAGELTDPLRMVRGVGAMTKPVIQELDVYHGTPHRFPATEANPLGEFDASKIGTGEGAQAYGHGIYLAEAKDVADQYANMPKFKLGVVENAQELGNNAKSFVERVEKFGSVEKAKVEAQELLREMQKQNIFPAVQQQLANEIDVANKLEKKIKVKATGIEPQVYKADLPDEMIDRMLDWDKPFLDQSQEIKDFAKTMLPPRVYDRVLMERTGDFIEALGVYKGGKAKAAELLRQAGIPGIKYLDAGSRGQGGSGTRNFVVFPGEEKKVRILERK